MLDIKPTLLTLLGIPHPPDSGVSLAKLVLGQSKLVPEPRDFFIETDFSPQSIRSVHPELHHVLLEGIHYFRLDPLTAHLFVKQSMLDLIISSKQYADFEKEWVLALYPQSQKRMMPILVNLKTGQWTNDLRTPFATQSPAVHMLHAMRVFYQNDLGSVENMS